MKSPLWVPATLLSTVLGFNLAMIVRAMQGPPEPLPSFFYPWSEPPMFWTWVERWADVATIVGFLGGLILLWFAVRDQHRIANEARRRPKLIMWFPYPDRPPDRNLKKSRRWYPRQANPGATYRRVFRFRVENIGDRTARNVAVTVSVDPTGTLTSGMRGAKPLLTGALQLPLIESIHPKRNEEVSVDLEVQPTSIGRDFEMKVVVSFDDYEPVQDILLIGVGPRDEGQDDNTVWPRVPHPNLEPEPFIED